MSHRRAKRNRKECRQQLIAAGATKKEAKVELEEANAPEHNFTDLDDTREQRREKRFKKRRHEATMRESSFIERRSRIIKWNKVFPAGGTKKKAVQA